MASINFYRKAMVKLKACIFLGLLFSFNLLADIHSPPEWVTKQDPHLMRFVSNDGKLSLFQKPSGPLVLANNYSVKDILPGDANDLTLVIDGPGSSTSVQRLLIWKRPQLNGNYDPMLNGNIYIFDLKTEKSEEIARGHSPQFHLNGQWVSWYSPGTRQIHFMFLSDRDIKFDIRLNPKIDTYFLPSVVMINQNNILYTDANTEDQVAIVFMDRMTKKSEIVYKAQSKGRKIELCKSNDSKVFAGEFSFLETTQGSAIYQLDNNYPQDKEKLIPLYSSALNDIGNINCHHDGKIYFIKSIQAKTQIWPSYDLFQLDIQTKKTISKTSWGDITQYLSFGNTILVQRNGKTYLIEGEMNSTQDQLGNTK